MEQKLIGDLGRVIGYSLAAPLAKELMANGWKITHVHKILEFRTKRYCYYFITLSGIFKISLTS